MGFDRDAAFAYMRSRMNAQALEVGKNELYKDISRGRWNWDYLKDRDKSLSEFIDMQLRVDKIPEYTSIDFIKSYFSKQFKDEYERYRDTGSDDEDNE